MPVSASHHGHGKGSFLRSVLGLLVVIHLQAVLPLVAQTDLHTNRPPVFSPLQVSAGAFGNAFAWGFGLTPGLNTRVVAEFYFSRNPVAGDGDDVKIFEMRHTVSTANGAIDASFWEVFKTTAFATNLFIPANLSGYYYFYQRLSFEDTGIIDADPGNNVVFSPEQIYVRPQPGIGVDYPPASLPNQRLMLVTTASTLGETGVGNTLATIQGGTFAIPYRSVDFPEENGTLDYAKTGNSSAQMTVTTTSGGLAGLQRIVNMTYDSPNTGTYSYNASLFGIIPMDSGNGFFYEITPVTNGVSLSAAYVAGPNGLDTLASNAVVLRWSGGAPPFTLETSPDCTRSDQWQVAQLPAGSGGSTEPATNLVFQSFAFSPTNRIGFYRIRGR